MKLVIAVVQDDDVDDLVKCWSDKGQQHKACFYRWISQRRKYYTLIGVENEKVDSVISIIKDVCKSRKQTFTTPIPPTGSAGVYIPYPIDVMVGGATIFVVDIDKFEKV